MAGFERADGVGDVTALLHGDRRYTGQGIAFDGRHVAEDEDFGTVRELAGGADDDAAGTVDGGAEEGAERGCLDTCGPEDGAGGEPVAVAERDAVGVDGGDGDAGADADAELEQ